MVDLPPPQATSEFTQTVVIEEQRSDAVAPLGGVSFVRQEFVQSPMQLDDRSPSDVSSGVIHIPIPLEPEWSDELEERFNQLAAREALEQASDNEIAELNHLEKLRNSTLLRPSGKELLRLHTERQVTQALKAALEQYVEFQEKTAR